MVATPKTAGALDGSGGRTASQRVSQPDPLSYALKRKLLGPPLVNEQLGEQRLSKPLALGVLSPDGISSSAYGTEEILIALVPVVGLAAFTLILPLTLVILLVMTLVVLSYREVVMVYIRPGGSYVVARENFGPRVAQICAVALLIDYVVTVAVQVAAGTAAVASAIPAIGPYKLEICVGVVVLMSFGNLRGLKEAGKAFAIPTYLFAGSVVLMIVVGLIREIFGGLPVYDPSTMHGTYMLGSSTEGIISAAMIFTLLRAFANGGASLTGIEAVSDAVGAFNPPEGRNARKVLIAEGIILGVLVAGIGWLAHATHATPYTAGYPTVLAQEAQIVFGHTFIGQAMFYLVQLATMLILYTGGNTSFNGFPFLTSYVAGDSFLPRWLLKRGHRLVFSNAILVLAVTSVALLIIKNADVNNLVPLYAIGVFTAFTMAGFGMAKYYHTHRGPGWRYKFWINLSAGTLSAIVVLIFGVVKFTEGAWVVLVLFAILVPALIRLNREYRDEAEVLETISGAQPPPAPHYSRRVVFVFVDGFDLATLAALRYARSLAGDPDPRGALRHRQRAGGEAAGEVDPGRPRRGPRLHRLPGPAAHQGRHRPGRAGDRGSRHARHGDPAPAQLLGAARPPAARPHGGQDRRRDQPGAPVGGHDRALRRAHPGRGAAGQARGGQDGLPRRPPRRRSSRPSRPRRRPSRPARPSRARSAINGGGKKAARADLAVTAQELARESDVVETRTGRPRPTRTPPPPGVAAIGSVTGGKVTVEGKVRVVEIRPVERNSVLAVEINDTTGNLTAMFYGRSHIPGLICGAHVRFTGSTGTRGGQPVMINPAYELISQAGDD